MKTVVMKTTRVWIGDCESASTSRGVERISYPEGQLHEEHVARRDGVARTTPACVVMKRPDSEYVERRLQSASASRGTQVEKSAYPEGRLREKHYLVWRLGSSAAVTRPTRGCAL